MLPKNLQTIIVKNQGHVIPNELLELILAKKPNTFGWAVQDEEELSVGREEGTPDMTALGDMNRDTVDYRSIVTFGWMEKGFNPEDIQPFVLNDDNDKPFLTLALEGDFPKHDTNNGRTQEYNFASEIIIPSLLDICELTDGDIAKLVAAIGKPSFNNNFLAGIGHRGVLSILPFQGELTSFSKNELGETYDWGYVSQRHGYGDAKQEPVVEVKKSRFSFGSKKTAAAAPVVKDAATPGTAPRASVPEVKAEVKPVTEKKEVSGPMPVRPPDWLHNNDDKRAWYQMVCGQLPSGWKKKIPVIPAAGVKVPATITDLQTWVAERKKSAIAASTVKPEVKTETAAGAPKTGNDIKAIRQEENLPIISAPDMSKVLDFVAKHLDGQSVEMMDPTTIQAMETKHGDFSAAVGCTPQESINWPVSGLFGLAKTDGRAIVLYALEMRNFARKYMEEKGMFKTPEKTSTTTETKIGDTGKKVESVFNEPAAPKKKFNFGKKAA